MCILVVDCGSSSMRGVLLNEKAEILFSSSSNYHMETDTFGKSEMHPTLFSNALKENCTKAAAFSRDNALTVEAISLTSQRSSVLPLDENGEPICNIITWHDKRSQTICDKINAKHEDRIRELTGTVLTPVLSAPKIRWIKDNLPEVYEKAHKIVGIHDYLIYNMTGEMKTDSSLASRSGLMDIEKSVWSRELIDIFGLDEDKLCEIIKPSGIAGHLSEDFARKTGLSAGIPVVSAGGDQQCSILGQGIVKEGEIGVTVGTGAYVAMLTDKPMKKERTNTSVSIIDGKWISEVGSMSAGMAYRWFNETFYNEENQSYSFEAIDKEIQSVPLGANDVIMLPYLAGSTAASPTARALLYGMTASTTRADTARAMLEGVVAEILACYEAIVSIRGDKPDGVIACGGLTKYPTFCQMLSDMLGVELKTYKTHETTVIGAWAAAAVTLGILPSYEASLDLPMYDESREYLPNEANTSKYAKLNQARDILNERVPYIELNEILR